MNATFGVDFRDREGDVIEKGIFLFLGEDSEHLLRFVNSDELIAFGEKCVKMGKEAYETYHV